MVEVNVALLYETVNRVDYRLQIDRHGICQANLEIRKRLSGVISQSLSRNETMRC